jgi:hypothetical protein
MNSFSLAGRSAMNNSLLMSAAVIASLVMVQAVVSALVGI